MFCREMERLDALKGSAASSAAGAAACRSSTARMLSTSRSWSSRLRRSWPATNASCPNKGDPSTVRPSSHRPRRALRLRQCQQDLRGCLPAAFQIRILPCMQAVLCRIPQCGRESVPIRLQKHHSQRHGKSKSWQRLLNLPCKEQIQSFGRLGDRLRPSFAPMPVARYP